MVRPVTLCRGEIGASLSCKESIGMESGAGEMMSPCRPGRATWQGIVEMAVRVGAMVSVVANHNG